MGTLHLVFIAFITHCLCVNGETFYEELLLKPLYSGHVYSHFQFTLLSNKSLNDDSLVHCKLFPLSLGEIISRYNIQEMHVSLTEGFWYYKKWGYPMVEAAPGVEVLVWFKDGTLEIDQKWKDLVNTLSGLLCASLNFINNAVSISPKLSFRPRGAYNLSEVPQNSNIRYATLPREIVCTENLTPWRKLLPCNANKGLATLLNSRYIHNTNYHSLGIHFRSVCMNNECTALGVELQQTVSLVHDLAMIGGSVKNWSFRKLFGMGLADPCPLAKSSNIYIDITSNQTGSLFYVSKQPHDVIKSTRGGHVSYYALYDVANSNPSDMFNVDIKYAEEHVTGKTENPILYANRYISGYGQERGLLLTKINNNHRLPIIVTVLENIPWFLPIYYQSLRITCESESIIPLKKHYYPGKSRTRPYYLEIMLQLPAHSITLISIEFDYIFLKWQEYPPDANHGFYVGSAVISAFLPYARNYSALPLTASTIFESCNVTSSDGYFIQMRTEPFILTLPTPDFSMPYNVICLACTVVALAFGPIHNITTKRLYIVKKEEKRGLRKVIANIQTLVQKCVFKKKEPVVTQ